MSQSDLKPLTLSSEAEILMNKIGQVKSLVECLQPLLDLLTTPHGEEDQDMIRRLLSVMTAVEVELRDRTQAQESLTDRLKTLENNQTAMMNMVSDIHRRISHLMDQGPDVDGSAA